MLAKIMRWCWVCIIMMVVVTDGEGYISYNRKCISLNPKMYLSTSQVVFVQMLKCICLVLPGLWVIWEAPGGGDPSGDQTEFTTCAHDNSATMHSLYRQIKIQIQIQIQIHKRYYFIFTNVKLSVSVLEILWNCKWHMLPKRVRCVCKMLSCVRCANR